MKMRFAGVQIDSSEYSNFTITGRVKQYKTKAHRKILKYIKFYCSNFSSSLQEIIHLFKFSGFIAITLFANHHTDASLHKAKIITVKPMWIFLFLYMTAYCSLNAELLWCNLLKLIFIFLLELHSKMNISC